MLSVLVLIELVLVLILVVLVLVIVVVIVVVVVLVLVLVLVTVFLIAHGSSAFRIFCRLSLAGVVWLGIIRIYMKLYCKE